MRRGYTFIEFCMVSVVLVVASLFIVPGLTRASMSNRSDVTKQIIANFDSQIELYKTDHHGCLPRLNVISLNDALCGTTDKFGKVFKDSLRDIGLKECGPYLSRFPVNPFNQRSSIRINGAAAGANSHGWRYDSGTGKLESDFPIIN